MQLQLGKLQDVQDYGDAKPPPKPLPPRSITNRNVKSNASMDMTGDSGTPEIIKKPGALKLNSAKAHISAEGQ